MDAIATVARQRRVLAIIADLIVTAATGKALRVAVAWAEPDWITFVDQLTQALHARGRRCHYLASDWVATTGPGPPTARPAARWSR